MKANAEPVTKALDCGVLVCPQRSALVKVGSSVGMVDPVCVTTVDPTDEVVARITKDWDRDVRAFDAVYAHILMMSDALTDGIIKQFPAKFQ